MTSKSNIQNQKNLNLHHYDCRNCPRAFHSLYHTWQSASTSAMFNPANWTTISSRFSSSYRSNRYTMSMFTLYQSRRQMAEMKIEAPKVMTTIQCTNKSCDAKTIREFQRGDYVYKELDAPCQKCSGNK